jgi:hypothetical protein
MQTTTFDPWDEAAAAMADPDSELVAACRQFNELEREMSAATISPDLSGDAVDVLMEAFEDRQRPLLEIIVRHRARTLGGICARVASLMAWIMGLTTDDDDQESWDTRLLTAVFRDLTAITERPPSSEVALADTPPSAEDAATLAACREYQAAFRLGAAWDRGEIPDVVGEAAHSRQFEEMDQLSTMSARSPVAILAKAHAAYLALSTMTDGVGEMETEIRLAVSALADVLGSAVS